MKLYLYKYNNYFNRIVKRESSLAGYGTPYVISGVNFNPADGVDTTIVCGTNDFQGLKDYCIVVDDSNSNAIVSRWFIVEENRTRNGQYELQLKRDLMVDYYDNIVQAPIMINRAMIADENNPLLFNPEGFSFNQIKKLEYPLNDGLQSRWAYIYFKKGYGNQSITVSLDDSIYRTINTTAANYFPANDTWVDFTDVGFELRAVANYAEDFNKSSSLKKYKWNWRSSTTSTVTSGPITDTTVTTGMIYFNPPFESINATLKNSLAAGYSSLKSNYLSEKGLGNTITELKYDELAALDGVIIKDTDDKLYSVSIQTATSVDNSYINSNYCPLTRTAFNTVITNTGISQDTPRNTMNCFKVNATTKKIRVHYELVTNGDNLISFTLYPNNGNKTKTEDSEFNIIAIPYDGISFFYETYYGSRLDIAQKVIRAITLNNADVVDVQLLPYCPYPYAIDGGYLNVREDLEGNQYELLRHSIPDPEDPESTITIYDMPLLYLNTSNFTFDINTSTFTNLSFYDSNNALNKKICNEVELWRLVSPNYDGQFEFSMAKNNGCNKFNVDVTCKPFNPYIHVNPNFKGLYGVDFDDARGLICNGDFSLPMETTAWSNYELQNKNYQIAFNRQIQNMDFVQGQEKTLAKWNIGAGSLMGVVSGGTAGGMATGHPAGVAVGAALGLGTSLTGGLIDYSMLKERQAENKSLALDNFSYQLGNIKAQPNIISKATPLTYNNKKFPFLEKYVATDQEIEILKNKILYNSMNVNAIGTIRDYIQTDKTFISGSLIRLEDTGLSAHEVNEIYNILAEGVYI